MRRSKIFSDLIAEGCDVEYARGLCESSFAPGCAFLRDSQKSRNDGGQDGRGTEQTQGQVYAGNLGEVSSEGQVQESVSETQNEAPQGAFSLNDPLKAVHRSTEKK